jgi:hypothetical protein
MIKKKYVILYVRSVHFVQFIIQTNYWTTYIRVYIYIYILIIHCKHSYMFQCFCTILRKLKIIKITKIISIKAVDRFAIKSVNVNKTWQLLGGCLYNLEILCWYLLCAGRLFLINFNKCNNLYHYKAQSKDLPEDGAETLKHVGVLRKYY